jgi:hypothetical protein
VSGLTEERDVERLFGLAPAAFVAARDEAARRLKREGDAEAAARVKALRRPSLSAWAVNQLARERRADLARLLEAGERLRAAHEAAVSGAGATELRVATRTERQAVAGLLEAAVEVLTAAGHPATDATRDRIAATLHAAAADPAAAEQVGRGRLTHDLDPSGFGALPDWAAADVAAEPAGNGERGGRPRAGAVAGRVGVAGRAAQGAAAPGAAAPAGAAEQAAARARRQAALLARDETRRRARLAADQAVLATRHAERLGRLADQAEREAARARASAAAAIDAAAAARERASHAAEELADAETRLAEER